MARENDESSEESNDSSIIPTNRRGYLKGATALAGMAGIAGLSGGASAEPYPNGAHEIPGRIEAENYDTTGYNDSTEEDLGSGYRDDPVDVEYDNGIRYLGYVTGTENVTYTVDASQGTYDMSFRIAAASDAGGRINVRLDGTLLGRFTIEPTGGWQEWQTVTFSGVEIPDVSGGELELDFDAQNSSQYLGNIDWVEFEVPGNDGGGEGDEGSSSDVIRPRNINEEVYAGQFDGGDLGAKVANARDYLASNGIHGTIRINEKPSGEPWVWSTDVYHDVEESGSGIGLDIICGANVRIRYDGDGWPLTVDNTFEASFPGSNFRLAGGWWYTESNPTGWLRMIDCTGDQVMPTRVEFETEDKVDHPDRNHTGSVAIALENDDYWCELNTIEGEFHADNGVDFRPASVTGGSGTSSFQSTTIRDSMFNIHQESGFGMRIDGNHGYSHYRRVALHLNAPNARGLVLNSSGTNLMGATFDSIKFENNDGTDGQTAIYTGEDYNGFYSPMFIGCSVSGGSIENQIGGGDDRTARYTVERGRPQLTGFGDKYALEFNPNDGSVVVRDPDGNGEEL